MTQLEKKKFLFSKQFWLLIIAFLISILLNIVILYLIFGNFFDAFQKMWNLRGSPTKTADAIASLSYIGTIFLTFYGLVSTMLFSFLVWRVSMGSFQVSKDLKSLEENRDRETVREQALIVYYDLQRGFSYLRDLYISTVIKGERPNPKRLFFSNDWIKNVATLRNELSSEELNLVFQMYNDFFTLQSLLESHIEEDSYVKNEISQIVKEMSQRFFADFLPLQILDRFIAPSAEDLIQINYYIILQKIYLLTFPTIKIEEMKTGSTSYDVMIDNVLFYSVLSGKPWDGEGILYTPHGNEKANGHFTKGLFMDGQVYGYFDTVFKRYLINYETTQQKRTFVKGEIVDTNGIDDERFYYKGEYQDGEIYNGITTEFNSTGTIVFRGNVISGVKEGKGTRYTIDGKPSFKGIYRQGERAQGALNKGKSAFVGDFQDGRPWRGQATNYDFNGIIRSFTGEIRDGKPHKGFGDRFKRNSRGDDLDYILHQENWEPDDDIDSLQQQQEEDYHEYQNEQTRKENPDWEDYITVDWTDGIAVERDDVEMNLNVYI